MYQSSITPTPLDYPSSVFWFLVGILISIILPIAVRVLLKNRGLEGGKKPSILERLVESWERYGGSKYLKVLFAAVLVALILVFILDLKLYSARDAAIAGIGWESLVNKVLGPNPRG